MKHVIMTVALTLAASPALAQLPGLGRLNKAVDTAQKIADLNISEKDERAIGEKVSAKLIDHFGVYQDAAVTKYVALVGTVLAQASSRPALDWKFIVLDTEGVNAYAAPGGIVHITRGALGLIKSEAELAGVLGHELIHVTGKHTINEIKKSKAIDATSDEIGSATGGLTGTLVDKFVDAVYDNIFNNKFSRNDEGKADTEGVTLANKVGYAPTGLGDFLGHLAARNTGRTEPSGLFASHPQLNDRLEKMTKTIKDAKLTSTAKVQARYASVITFDAKPAAEVAALMEGTRGVTGGGSVPAKPAANEPAKTDAKKEDASTTPKKKGGFGLGAITSSLSGGKQAESTQASASAGGRMVGPDTNAPGGSNKSIVKVTLTPAEIAEFKKGIA
jgi:predicted Zn-dependent protease